MGTPNWANRTIFTGDNLDIMRGMNSETVDLIYLDPPFNSNRNYAAPVGSKAAGAAFKDTWTLSDLDVAWMGLVADQEPAIYKLLEAARLTHGKGMQSYLCMMAVRLLEMRRLLKETGSIYLHCDSTAGHYLKVLMDAVFGARTFWSAITWKRTSAHNDRLFGSESDTILMYGGSVQNVDAVRTSLDEKNVTSKYRYQDERGRYRTGDLTGAGASDGESGAEWRGYNPSLIGRHWAIPKTGKYARFLDEMLLPGYLDIEGVHNRLDALDKAKMIHYSSRGGMPALKRYLPPDAGQVPGNLWTDIDVVNAQAKERIGYPTQKPLALLKRIIKASSNENDVVLDPFAGCATTLIAAQAEGRDWVGIDLSPKAVELVKQRIDALTAVPIKIHPRTDIPQRTDIDAPIHYRQNKHVLFGRQEGVCNGCKMDFPFKIFDVDHVVPKSRGGTDHIDNLQLLCSSCNRIKGDRPMEYLMAQLAQTNAPTVFR